MTGPRAGLGVRLAGTPSDSVEAVAACGTGDVVGAVLSLSRASATGDDAGYLDWHLHDHLPEQYRIAGLRHGARFVSTPACRAARLTADDELGPVDHVVSYLFAPPLAPALDAFFDLGAALRAAGRMPVGLPPVQLGGWSVEAMAAAPAAVVGAAVVPWRPSTGILLIIEHVQQRKEAAPGAASPGWAPLVSVPGVVGAWSLHGAPLHRRLADTSGLEALMVYLDGPPVDVLASAAPILRARWAAGQRVPRLVAPFHAVDPAAVDRYLPAAQ